MSDHPTLDDAVAAILRLVEQECDLKHDYVLAADVMGLAIASGAGEYAALISAAAVAAIDIDRGAV